MAALEAEHIAGSLTRARELPAAAVGELESRAGIGPGARPNVPLVGHCHLLRKIQRHRPAAERGAAGIGNRYVHLEGSTRRIGRRSCTGVRGECLIAQQQAGQQHSKFYTSFH